MENTYLTTLLLSLSAVALVILFFAQIRNTYTYTVTILAINAIRDYNLYLIRRDKYNSKINYYDIMMLEYSKVFWNIFAWGKYSAIRKEYRSILEKFYTQNKTKE